MKAARYDIGLDEKMDITSTLLGFGTKKEPFSSAKHYLCRTNFEGVDVLSSYHNLRLGFLLCLQYVMRMKPGSLLWSGLPCSLHIWISRGTSGKSRSNPRGVFNGCFMHECVRIANCIACRFGLIAIICLVRKIWWDTEQPASSVAQWLPYLEVALHPDRTILGFQSSLFQKLPLGCMNAIAYCSISCP